MVEITGLSELMHQLDQYQTIRDEEFEQASREGFDYLKSPLQEYPPEREGQTYIRTETLKFGWDESTPVYLPTEHGFTATLPNTVSYGPYVMGDPDQTPHQAWMHVGRWHTTQEISDDNESDVVSFFSDALDRMAARLGGP